MLFLFSHQFVTWSSRARNLLSSRTIHLAQPQQKPNDDEAFFPFEKTNKQTEQNHLRNVCNTCNLREKHSQWGEISFQFPNANESSMSENHNAQHIFHKRFDSFFAFCICDLNKCRDLIEITSFQLNRNSCGLHEMRRICRYSKWKCNWKCSTSSNGLCFLSCKWIGVNICYTHL